MSTVSFLERRLRAPSSVLLAGGSLAWGPVTAAARTDFARIEAVERGADAPLRVCGDPDKLPLSHADGSGFARYAVPRSDARGGRRP